MAKDVRYFLNEADKGLLDEVIADFLRRNPDVLSGHARKREPAGESSGTLLVRTPGEGVPALQDADTTGTAYQDAEDDTPGSAVCQVYQVIRQVGPTHYVRRVPGRFELVVNMSTVTLGAGQWLLIHRDRFGTWFAGSVLGIEFAEC